MSPLPVHTAVPALVSVRLPSPTAPSMVSVPPAAMVVAPVPRVTRPVDVSYIAPPVQRNAPVVVSVPGPSSTPPAGISKFTALTRSEEHTPELHPRPHGACRARPDNKPHGARPSSAPA